MTFHTPPRVHPVIIHPSECRCSLNDGWRFRLDPEDRGRAEKWYTMPHGFVDAINVPGCWQGQGFGNDGTETVWDFRLEAQTLRATYTGTGWYCREFTVPDEWYGKRVFLNFGGVHPSAEVWVNGVYLGENGRPFVPFAFDVTSVVRAAGPNVVVVRVHEAERIMGLAYSWQGNWSGLYRGVELTATGDVCIGGFSALPDVDGELVKIRVHVDSLDRPKVSAPTVLRIYIYRGDDDPGIVHDQEIAGEETEFTIAVPSPVLWSPDSPALYRIDAVLLHGGNVTDALTERTGFVKLSTKDKHFLINDEPYYMRGTGAFLPYPETASPDTDRTRLRKKLTILREYGYNYVRCQSYVPAPEYYEVADEVGLLVQSEMGMLGAWGSHNQWHIYAWPQPDPEFRGKLKVQWDAVVRRDICHPSANIYCMSNELGSDTNYRRTAWRCNDDTKAMKPSCMVIWTDGGYNPDLPGDFVNAEADLDSECENPLIQHEYRWWSSFPDVTNAHRYDGAVRPYAVDIALKAATQHGVAHVLPDAAKNSQRLQYIEAKTKMEQCRRDNPDLAGICHFNAMDTNPSPQGIVNEFYERKYADALMWLQTNGDTALMCDLGFGDRVYSSGDTFTSHIYVSDFSHPPLKEPDIEWDVSIGDIRVTGGRIRLSHVPFQTHDAGEIRALVPDVDKPEKAVLKVRIDETGRVFENTWNLWFFPARIELPDHTALYGGIHRTWTGKTGFPKVEGDILEETAVLVTERLDNRVTDFMHRGGRVILAASEGLVRPFGAKLGLTEGRYFFTPPANYPPYEDGHNATIIAQHPAFGDLAHEGFADLHFYRMLSESPPLPLEPLGLSDADPILRAIHSYPVGRSLAYLVERSYGKGGIILCALDLNPAWPEARYLLASMCRYVAGKDFRPETGIDEAGLRHITDSIV